MAFTAICSSSSTSHSCAEGLAPCVLVRVLLSVIHFLLESLRLLLIGERKCGQAVLELEGVEKHAVLVVAEGIVYFLIPNDTAAGWLPLISSSSQI
jgi:hypothetical protein